MRSWSARQRPHRSDWDSTAPTTVAAQPLDTCARSWRTSPVAVVGSAGFLGSYLVRALHRAGTPAFPFPRGRTFAGSADLLRAHTVIFVAGSVTPATAAQRPDLVVGDRTLLRDLLSALRGAHQPPRVVLASSAGTVYSPDAATPYDEGSPPGPSTAYGHMKLAMEADLLTCPWVAPVVLRLSNVFGPGQRPRGGQGVIAHWLHAVAAGHPLVIYGDPGSSRDYIYVDDVVEAMRLTDVADRPLPHVINIGGGRSTSLAELACIVARVVGDDGFTFARQPPRCVDRSHVSLSVCRAEAALDWRPRFSLEDGLRRTWAWVCRIGLGGRVADGAPVAHHR